MMVMTRVSDRPVTEPAGTMGADGALRELVRRVRVSPVPASTVRPPAEGARRAWKRSAASRTRGEEVPAAPDAPDHSVGLSNDPDMALVQLQARRLGLAHELMIVGSDQDR